MSSNLSFFSHIPFSDDRIEVKSIAELAEDRVRNRLLKGGGSSVQLFPLLLLRLYRKNPEQPQV
jgi:hypothetical protein